MFEEMFGNFFTDPMPDPREEELRKIHFGVEPAFNMRRLSGGAALPRGRYYTLCESETGYSAQTLAMELLAYATTDGQSEIQVYDLNDPWADAVCSQLDATIRRQVDAHNRRVLLVTCGPVVFNPNVAFAADFDPFALRTYFVIPYKVETLWATNVLDMREGPAIEWLLHLLWEYFPGVVFKEGEEMPYAETLEATGGRGPPVVYFEAARSDADPLSVVENAKLLNVGLKDLPGHEWPLPTYLQYIRHRALGGTPMDDMIGLCIQRMGAEVLIYPSARHDSLVRYRDGAVYRWLGFNLIDYRNFPTAHSLTTFFLVQNPAFWQGIEGALELPLLQANPYAVADWAVHGTTHLTRQQYRWRAWSHRLHALKGLSLPEPIIVERQRWHGYDGRRWRRKPREFEEVLDLRLSLITGEIELDGKLVTSVRQPQPVGVTLGAYLAEMSQRLDLWGGGQLGRAVHPAETWCIVQEDGEQAFQVVCPACGDRQLGGRHAPKAFLFCHACLFGLAESSLQSPERVIAAVEQAVKTLASPP